MIKGIDISEHQTGYIDYTTLSKNLDFVILREGCKQRIDNLFTRHVNGFKATGLPIKAVYHFIYALNESQVKREAQSAIKNVKAAGLSKDTFIFADFEYDTIDSAARKGIKLGRKECNSFTRVFCDAIKEAGYPTGIYTNLDYYNNYYDKDLLARYPIWLCDLTGQNDYPCAVWQYSWKGQIPGYNGNLDMDYWMEPVASDIVQVFDTKEEQQTQKAIESAVQWMINLANDNTHGYDQAYRWGPDYDCSSAVISAYQHAGVPVKTNGATYTGNMRSVFLKTGFIDITQNINLSNGSGLLPGDVLLNYVHHTAMYIGNGNEAEASINEFGGVSGGQVGDQTGREILIRPYRNYPWNCVLRYSGKPESQINHSLKKELNKTPKWVGEVTADILNVRTWAGTEFPNIKSWPILSEGNLVDVCDTIYTSEGEAWYYIRIDGKIYGFVCARYIKRV